MDLDIHCDKCTNKPICTFSWDVSAIKDSLEKLDPEIFIGVINLTCSYEEFLPNFKDQEVPF